MFNSVSLLVCVCSCGENDIFSCDIEISCAKFILKLGNFLRAKKPSKSRF